MKLIRRSTKEQPEPAAPERREEPPVLRSLEEEAHETLTLLELKELPRDEKRAVEREVYDGVGVVEFHEQEFRRRRRESLADVRRAVDALVLEEPQPEPQPEPEPPAVEPAPEPAPEPAEAEAASEPEPQNAPEKPGRDAEPLTKEEMAKLQRHVPGKVKDAVVLYRTDSGRVVEARYKTSAGEERTELLTFVRGEIKKLDDIRTHADALTPKRAVEASPAETEAAVDAAVDAPEEDADAQPKKRGLFKRNPKGDEAEAPAEPEAEPASDAAPKRRLFGRKEKAAAEPEGAPTEPADETPAKKSFFKRKAKDAPADATDGAPAEADVEPPAEKKRLKLPFRKRADVEDAAADESPEDATAAPADADDGKKHRFSLRRGKK